MRKLFMALGLIWSAPLAAQQVEVAEGNWADIPEIRPAGHLRISDTFLDRADALLSRGGACDTGKTPIEMTIPFIMEFDPAGAAVKRVVVQRVGCPQLEQLVGGAVLTMARQGEYKPSGENAAHWYRAQISFTSN